MHFIDAHTHVQFAAFKKDWKEVIARALADDVWLVNVGTQKDTSQRAIEIADAHEEGVYAAVGLHPIHTGKSFHDADELGGDKGFTSRGEEFDMDHYRKLASHQKVVAIGECGFDYYRIQDSEFEIQEVKKKQREAFTAQIELAHEVGKPLMIHCRSGENHNAFADLVSTLNSESRILNSSPGIIHFFSGSREDAAELLDMGFSFTFGGVVTFTHDYDEIITTIPSDRILSETDAPYVTPAPHRGKRNEPAYVVEVVRRLAELKGISEGEMKEQIWKNARRAFGI